jgi:hypothetical protein
MDVSLKQENEAEPRAARSRRLLIQIAWFVALWIAGVAALAVVAGLIRMMIHA